MTKLLTVWWRYLLLALASLATSMVVTQLTCLLYAGQGHRTAHSRANLLTERGISTDHGNSDPDFKFWCFSCTAVCSSEQSFVGQSFLWCWTDGPASFGLRDSHSIWLHTVWHVSLLCTWLQTDCPKTARVTVSSGAASWLYIWQSYADSESISSFTGTPHYLLTSGSSVLSERLIVAQWFLDVSWFA